MQPVYFPNADLSYLTIYSEETIKKVFNDISKFSSIEFNYPQGGCQQRAQIMSMLLSSKYRIDHCKIWLFSPAALYPGDPRTLYVNDVNNFTSESRIEWNYHVAPVVRVQMGKSVQTIIVDPSLNASDVLLLNDWLNIIGNSNVSKYTFLLPDKYFFNCTYNSNNELTTIFDGSFYNYADSDKNDLTLEKGLAANDMAIHILRKYLQQDESNLDIKFVDDVKAIFGNATALDFLFIQNKSGYTENTTLRYVVTTYSNIFDEARSFLSERIIFWTKITNDLMTQPKK